MAFSSRAGSRVNLRNVSCNASPASRAFRKAELLSAIKPLKRGATATDEDKQKVEKLAAALEKMNPNPKSLSAPEISGKWVLVYTTSESILGNSRPALARPSGPIYQIIDAEKLRAKNMETAPLFTSVTAELTPQSDSKVFVQFKQFKFGNVVPVPAPSSFVGELDTTYVDSELRISRGDKGNLFVLLMEDPTVRL